MDWAKTTVRIQGEAVKGFERAAVDGGDGPAASGSPGGLPRISGGPAQRGRLSASERPAGRPCLDTYGIIEPPRNALAASALANLASRNAFNTPDGRRSPDGPELEVGEGWSYQLEASPPPVEWAPVAAWDLPAPPSDRWNGLTDEQAELEGAPADLPGRPAYCGRYSLIGELEGKDDGRLGVLRLLCGRYLCPVCGPVRGRKVRRGLVAAALRHRLVRIVTLTLEPARVWASGLEPHAYLKRCFNRLRYRWRKAYPKGVQYIAVVEHHKSGMPHLHLLVSRFVPQRVLKGWWRRAGGGYEVRISYRDPGRAGRYLAKYITKQLYLEMSGQLTPPRSRRWQVSRGIKVFPPRELREKAWRLLRESIDRIAQRACWYRESLDSLRVGVDARGRWLRFVSLAASDWWPIAYSLGLPVEPI